jgi:hypothetical protein
MERRSEALRRPACGSKWFPIQFNFQFPLLSESEAVAVGS